MSLAGCTSGGGMNAALLYHRGGRHVQLLLPLLPALRPRAPGPRRHLRRLQSPRAPTHVYRLLLSVATHDRVIPVVLFDCAARALLGSPAEELACFFAAHPGAARAAAEALQGQTCRMALRASKKGTAECLRAVSVAPFLDGFRPVIGTVRSLYPGGG